jgi:ABC-type transport system substrate-binding protein
MASLRDAHDRIDKEELMQCARGVGRSSLVAVGLLLAIALGVGDVGAAQTPPQRGGELTILDVDDFQSLDPIFAEGPDYLPAYEYLFDFRRNEKGQWALAPMLATQWKLEGTKLTVQLRQGVKFHDGSELDAEAVAWNIRRMVQHPKSRMAGELAAVDKKNPVEVRDRSTVQINLNRPSTGLLIQLSSANDSGSTGIVSRKAVEAKGEDWLRTNPVGTGPYRFGQYRSRDRLVMLKNDQYWRAGADGKPLPYPDKITYRIIIESSTQFAELQAGTADIMWNIPARDIPAAKRIAHARFFEAVDSHLSKKRPLYINAAKPPFKDNLTLRQAILHAIDREAMAKVLSPGLGRAHPYTLLPGQVGYDAKVPFHEFDVEKAKRLLQESGVKLPFEVKLNVHSRELDQRQAQVIQAMLGKAGIKVNIEVLEGAAMSGRIRSGDWELSTGQDGADADPLDGFKLAAIEAVKDPGLHALLMQVDAETNPTRQHDLLVQAQKMVTDNAWMGWLWLNPGSYLVNNRVQNFQPPWNAVQDWEAVWIRK